MDIKGWLEQTSEQIAETCFPPGDAPLLPYIVYFDRETMQGSDSSNDMVTHEITVERYSDDNEYSKSLEKLFDDKKIKYTREQIWLPKPDDMFETIYDFDVIERI